MIDVTMEAEALRRDVSDRIASGLMTSAELAIEDALSSVAARAFEEGREAKGRDRNPYR